jgi:hypothetical protein
MPFCHISTILHKSWVPGETKSVPRRGNLRHTYSETHAYTFCEYSKPINT